MPITSLDLLGCNELHELAALEGMPLTDIALTPASFTSESLAVLRSCKTLRTITIGTGGQDRYAAAEFWKKLDAGEIKLP